MRDYFDDWEPETLQEQATRALVEKHRDEYDELAGKYREERAQELERRIFDLQKQLADARGQNPNGTLVPALEQTANMLSKANDELAVENKKLHADLTATRKQLDDIKKAVSKKVSA